ncbi:hypothetical protein AAG570_009182 [Ranatra chinensis]|uniref:Uncharacterized protein n=1 Tax=Ranatra chinensis TaxID=642074 RepID=A0ABD0Z3M7_9HEMI
MYHTRPGCSPLPLRLVATKRINHTPQEPVKPVLVYHGIDYDRDGRRQWRTDGNSFRLSRIKPKHCRRWNDAGAGRSTSWSWARLKKVEAPPQFHGSVLDQSVIGIVKEMSAFDGNPEVLEEWLTVGARAGNYLARTTLHYSRTYGVLMRRLSSKVRAECHLEVTTGLNIFTSAVKSQGAATLEAVLAQIDEDEDDFQSVKEYGGVEVGQQAL